MFRDLRDLVQRRGPPGKALLRRVVAQWRRVTYATIGIEKQANMTIPATYENGVFKPLEDVQLTEGTRVEVHVLTEAALERPKSVRDWPIFGIWADRDDIPDGVTYEDRIRQPRY